MNFFFPYKEKKKERIASAFYKIAQLNQLVASLEA